MRDVVVIAVLGGGALFALYRPWVGAMLWTWLSLMSPHVEFGYSTAGMPFALLIALTTFIGFLATKDRHNPFVGAPIVILAAFVVWICITLPFSIYLEQSWPLFVRSMKIFLMLFVTIALIDTRKKLDVFMWVCALSIGFFGFKGGLFTIVTGGNFRVWGPGGFVGGNNEIALALITVIPLIRYLQTQQSERWVQHAMTAWMLLCAVAALGSHSRGALLALGAMTLFFWYKGKNKLTWGVLILLAVVVLLPFMPDHWWDRMRTIQTYEQDESALGRINAWWNAFNLANSKFFGGGFMIYTPEVFASYSPDPLRVHAAHSIYFQVLGEHGWVGLILYVAVGASAWISANRLIALVERNPGLKAELNWATDLSRMIQVSLIGFGTGGAFLSLAYFDMPYNLVAAVALANWLCLRRVAANAERSSPHLVVPKVAA